MTMPLTSFLVITFILLVANSALSLKIHLRIEDDIDDDKEVVGIFGSTAMQMNALYSEFGIENFGLENPLT